MGEPVHTTGPLASRRKTHASFSPGFGGGSSPRHTEDAPPLEAWVSHLEIRLFRGLGGGVAEGRDRGAGAGRTGNAGSFALPTRFFSRNPVFLRLQQPPQKEGAPPPRPSTPPLRPFPDPPGGASRKIGAALGTPLPCPRPSPPARELGGSPRNAGPRVSETGCRIWLVSISSSCGDCLDYYRAVFDYNLLFNHDDISICWLMLFLSSIAVSPVPSSGRY